MAVGVKLLVKKFVVFAPKDIRDIIRSRPNEPRWLTVLGYILMIVLLLCVAALFFWAGKDALDKEYNFGMIFVRFIILLEGYKLFDIIVFDWLLPTKSNIFQKLYPETIGCEGYKKFGFNLKTQLIKIFVFAAVAALTAAILSCL